MRMADSLVPHAEDVRSARVKAERLLEKGWITDSDLLDLLEELDWREGDTKRPPVFGPDAVQQSLWGLFRHGGIVNVTKLSKDKPWMAKVLNKSLGQRFPGCFWTSAVLIRGGASLVHRDTQNAEGTFNHAFAVAQETTGYL